MLIKYLKLCGIFLGIIMITAFFLGLLNLIGVSHKITTILSAVIMLLLFLSFGIIEGMNTLKKGFIAGFKIGILFLLIIFLLNLILFQTPLQISRIIYYAILLFSSILGAMVGINRKKKE